MVIAGVPREEIRQMRSEQDWLAEGSHQEAARVALRCGPLSEAITARIQALLDFQAADNLTNWLATLQSRD